MGDLNRRPAGGSVV